jgi:hypothetical protein
LRETAERFDSSVPKRLDSAIPVNWDEMRPWFLRVVPSFDNVSGTAFCCSRLHHISCWFATSTTRLQAPVLLSMRMITSTHGIGSSMRFADDVRILCSYFCLSCERSAGGAVFHTNDDHSYARSTPQRCISAILAPFTSRSTSADAFSIGLCFRTVAEVGSWMREQSPCIRLLSNRSRHIL